jgi:LuxR family transcriptional regulator, maltose regulon positive regulatory protein
MPVMAKDRAAGEATGIVSRPGLFARLGTSARVTVVTAPAGSGKTVLLRSWIGAVGLADRVAWVSVEAGERDPQLFWASVTNALRQTARGAELVRLVSAAPDLDGWLIVEQLLEDLAPLVGRLWLVVDDVHELGSSEALRQLELLVMRAPPGLRFVLSARRDVRLGLHRLRLEGGLEEIRGSDLRFSVNEARELFAASEVGLPESALTVLHERTEGWAAGLRLAALSLAGHPDPARFAGEFSGAERTVAEYLLAEVLDRQPEDVRRLLLRTSILERVNGELADLLTGDTGGERVLLDLERIGAFTASLDTARTWFRYHQMFADLLRLELRRAEPNEVARLHRAAAGWLARHGDQVGAVRHALATRDWEVAARLLADYWPGLYLGGQAAVVHDLLAGFPVETIRADAELAAVGAGDELARGSLEAAEWYLALSEQQSASVPADRRWQCRVLLGVVRVLHARQRGNAQAVAAEAQRLQDDARAQETEQSTLSEDLRALALISLGSSEVWTTRVDDAPAHLMPGVEAARATGRPFLELGGLAHLAVAELLASYSETTASRGSLGRTAEFARRAIDLAERHGWTGEPAYGIAARALGAALSWQVRPAEAEPWIEIAERTVTADTEPAAAVAVRYGRGALELARRRDREALAAFRDAEELARRLTGSNLVIPLARAVQVVIHTRLGESEEAEQVLASLGEREQDRGDVRVATAGLRLAQDDPDAAAAALAPVLDGSAPARLAIFQVGAFLLEAKARDALAEPDAANRALERAVDLAERDGALLWFLLYPAPGLLERHTRLGTLHASMVADIQSLLAGRRQVPPVPGQVPPAEPLSGSELRVLRYLPTNLNAPEIAREMFVSPNTVRTHIRHMYAKFGTHHRAETVERARALGLLAPSGTGLASRRDLLDLVGNVADSLECVIDPIHAVDLHGVLLGRRPAGR